MLPDLITTLIAMVVFLFLFFIVDEVENLVQAMNGLVQIANEEDSSLELEIEHFLVFALGKVLNFVKWFVVVIVAVAEFIVFVNVGELIMDEHTELDFPTFLVDLLGDISNQLIQYVQLFQPT